MKQSLPKISVIVPNLNYGNYIEECLNSIIIQSYPYLEIIVIDGGSTDNSLEIIDQFKKKITILISENDNGQAEAINKGFILATGEYICYLNSDDCFLPNTLTQTFKTKRFQFQDFIYSKVLAGESISNAKKIDSQYLYPLKSSNILKFFYSQDYIIPSQGVFVKKEFLDKNNIMLLNTQLKFCMDMEWFYRISKEKPNYLYINEYLTFFRLHDTTKTVSQNKKMQLEAIGITYHNLQNENSKERLKISKLLLLTKILSKFYSKKIKISPISLFKTFYLTYPISLNNRKFLGLFKKMKI